MSFGLARGKQLDTTGVGRLQQDLPQFEDEPVIDPREWFDESTQRRPFQLEIGSGKGTFLVQQAALQPDINFLGIEYAGEFYRYAADRIRRHGLANVRMLCADAIEFVRYRLPDGFISVIHLYFPDPWPKKRHHKRRAIQDQSLADFHRVLEPAGEVRIVTDHDDYWSWIEAHVDRNATLFDRLLFERPESAGADEVVGTNFERKYRREGRPFHGLILRKRG